MSTTWPKRSIARGRLCGESTPAASTVALNAPTATANKRRSEGDHAAAGPTPARVLANTLLLPSDSHLRIFAFAVGPSQRKSERRSNLYNAHEAMFQSMRVVGRGRVGTACAARLAERGHDLVEADAELVLLCVPDGAIAEVARSISPGPWIAHTSGATPLAALAPHTKRFGLHPLQTIVLGRGPEQLDGAWAAVTGETDDAIVRAKWLATELGLLPFQIRDEMRALYHAGAATASNYLVTLHRAAVRMFELSGAPPQALLPLMRRVIDNGFELTGPIARGDWATVDAHLAAIRQYAPELETLYLALAGLTAPALPREVPSRRAERP